MQQHAPLATPRPETLDAWVASLLETAPPPSAEILALLGFDDAAPASAASAA